MAQEQEQDLESLDPPIEPTENWFSKFNPFKMRFVKPEPQNIYAVPREPIKEDVGSIASQFGALRSRLMASKSGSTSRGHIFMAAFADFFAYVCPFLLIAWIGTDLGAFYAGSMGQMPAYGLAYTFEFAIAALTVKMGQAFEEAASGRSSNNMPAFIVVVAWILLNFSSAFGLYMVLSHGGNVQGVEFYNIIVRVAAVALVDFACSTALMIKSASAQREIEHMKKQAVNIELLSAAERSIEEAEKNAKLRDQMMKATLKIQEDMSEQIGQAVTMIMGSIMEKMEKSLKDGGDKGKNEKVFGGR